MSGNWQDTYSTVLANSATNWNNSIAKNYTHTNFLPLSGGTMTGKLNLLPSTASSAPINLGSGVIPSTTIAGDVFSSGNNIFFKGQTGGPYIFAYKNDTNTFLVPQIISTVSPTGDSAPALRITQAGGGEALRIEDETNPDSTPFIVNSTGSVGIGLSSLNGGNAKLTVVGNISASGVVYTSNNGNSNNWNNVYSSVYANSANWDSVYSNVYANSAVWASNDTALINLTGDWESTHSSVYANSGSWQSTNSSVYAISANWSSVYSNVNANSAVWNAPKSEVSGLTGNWESTYSTVQSNSAQWASNDTELVNLTGNWDSTYSAVQTNSAYWNEPKSDVRLLSSNWEDTYTFVNSNSSFWEDTYSTVLANSAYWNEPKSDVTALTSNWENTHTTVFTNSASNWENSSVISYVDATFLPLTGGIITGDLTVTNIISCGNGLVVDGSISATGSYYGDGSQLTGIVAGDTQATTLVRTNSGFWQDTYTTVQANSATNVKTVATTTPGTSAVTTIVAVSAFPTSPDPATLYIII